MRNSESPRPDTLGPDSSAAPPVAGPGQCYVPAAPVAEVMVDQLEYLLGHSAQRCAPDCVDCGRLQQVRNWLLLPFHTATHPIV